MVRVGKYRTTAKIGGICWLSNARWHIVPTVSPSESSSVRLRGDSLEGMGCLKGCMIHLTLLGVLALAMLVWALRNRVWELEVTVELPEKAPELEESKSDLPEGDPAP